MLEKIKRKLKQNEFIWRYGRNLQPTLAYRLSSVELTNRETKIIQQLKTNGFAKSTVFELFDDLTCFDDLQQANADLESSRASEIEKARKEATSPDPRVGKSFKLSLLGPKPVFEFEGPFARFAFQNQILKIANAYFGMYVKLKYYNVWLNFAVDHPAKASQLWHRDRDDIQILKVFVYLSDVNDGAGPFTYARGTHRKGDLSISPEYFWENGVARSTDEQMNSVLPPERFERATGPKGTIVFADTRGFHKGGLARTEDRLLYTFMFTSPSAEVENLMTRSGTEPKSSSKQLLWLLPD